MKKTLSSYFQIAAVFIGTIVGAGLASGKEITQFFTSYGYKSFIGLIICFIIYALCGTMMLDISIKYNLNSYNDLIALVSPGIFGMVTDVLITAFFMCSASIILAGSGALIKQFCGVSKWIGIGIMVFLSVITLLREIKGLVDVNSFIVPCLITVISMIFILYLLFCNKNFNITYIKSIPHYKNFWLISSMLYASFNIFSCSSILVPLAKEYRDKKLLKTGLILGALGLTIISVIINLLLMFNTPYIYKYEIPLLYIAHRFGKPIQAILLVIIWLEMFSTVVSDIYSLSKTLGKITHISYKKSMLIVILLAICISQIGFGKLIQIVYPGFGAISLIFLIQLVIFYFKDRKLPRK